MRTFNQKSVSWTIYVRTFHKVVFFRGKVGIWPHNLGRFWAVYKLTKLKNIFGDYVVHVNYHPPIKFQYFLSSLSWDNEASSAPVLGWGLNSSRFGNFVPGSTYFLQSFLGYETETKNVRLNMRSYGSPTWFSIE